MEFNKIYLGDAKEVLESFVSNSIDMCITSPPYFGLRDYGIDKQIGNEDLSIEYLIRLKAVFKEVHRVLKSSGTCWVNISDKYLNKDMLSIPERFVIEMSKLGWYRRNTIIWHKPNIMPLSVKDRFTQDFEYLYLFTKSKNYYFEQQFEEAKPESLKRYKYGLHSKHANGIYQDKNAKNTMHYSNKMEDCFKDPTKRNMRTVWNIPTANYKGAHFATFPEKLIETPIIAGCPEGGVVLDPFIGSGTTAIVAMKNNRNFVGIELNPEYIDMALNRAEFTNGSLSSFFTLDNNKK